MLFLHLDLHSWIYAAYTHHVSQRLCFKTLPSGIRLGDLV